MGQKHQKSGYKFKLSHRNVISSLPIRLENLAILTWELMLQMISETFRKI